MIRIAISYAVTAIRNMMGLPANPVTVNAVAVTVNGEIVTVTAQ